MYARKFKTKFVICNPQTLATRAHVSETPSTDFTSLQKTEHKKEEHYDKQYNILHHFLYF
jgi:hypothetical protein